MTSERIGWWAVNPTARFISLCSLCLCELPELSYGTFLSRCWDPYPLLIVSCRLQLLFLFSKKNHSWPAPYRIASAKCPTFCISLLPWQEEGIWVTLLQWPAPGPRRPWNKEIMLWIRNSTPITLHNLTLLLRVLKSRKHWPFGLFDRFSSKPVAWYKAKKITDMVERNIRCIKYIFFVFVSPKFCVSG